ncbi:MAG: protein kinase, partial [Deltaproteobacteria bacterium]
MAISPLSISPPGEPLICKQCDTAIEVSQNFCPVCGTPAQGENAPDPLVGAVVADRYKVIGLIGRGGMGVVYKCEHTRMGKIMAIKLLHGDLARDVEIQRRFRREAQAASRLSHPNTVSIFDFGTSEGLMYLVMEYVSGEDMGRVLRATRHMPSTRAAAIAAQACGSLAEAHENGIVHRDLKPENLLISQLKDSRDFVKLLDFGLAKLREGEDRNEITSAGTLVGTPYYMAPEIIRAQDVDGRADIYALGAVIYRAVTGTPAFSGQSPVAVLTRALTDEL